MTALDKLRALIEAYNPPSSQRTDEGIKAHHELALLAHWLLLPMAEALERCAEKIEHTASSHASEQWEEAKQARAVLAKLEEALDGAD